MPAANPLLRSQNSGIRMNDRIGDLFAKIGTSAHPRGDVLSAYRRARMAMEVALEKPNRLQAATDVLNGLRSDLRREVLSVFREAVSLGEDEVQRQIRFYESEAQGSINLTTEMQTALDAVMTRFEAQSAAIRALLLTDSDPEQIVGTEDRTGVLAAGDVIAGATYWATFLVWNAFDQYLNSTPSAYNYQKQAIAALDNRTTNCCLEVHGQVQAFDKPFILTGTPRFADKMDFPAFHYYCRTSVTLYVAEFDDGLTQKMQDSAKFFLKERAAGKNPDRSPADAFA